MPGASSRCLLCLCRLQPLPDSSPPPFLWGHHEVSSWSNGRSHLMSQMAYIKVIGDPGVSLARSQNDQTIQTDISINHVMYIAMFMIQNCIDQGLSKCTPKARGTYLSRYLKSMSFRSLDDRMSKSPPGSTFGLVFLWTWIYLCTCLSLGLVFLWTCLSLDLSFFGLGSTFGLVPYVDIPLDLSFFEIP